VQAEPFSRVIRVEAVPRDGQTVTIEANAAELRALAAFLKLPSIESLRATFALARSGRGGLRASGSVKGELTQVCGVSLEPFSATVDEEVDVRFLPNGAARVARAEPESFSVTDEDEPEPIVDGQIDLGAVAREFFALGLDPYPRKPGARFESPEEPEANVSPFSVLASRAEKKPG
jgi:uncharacterized metal-binding protein YceD (DUF177 family)